jgi:hypothetical protein
LHHCIIPLAILLSEYDWTLSNWHQIYYFQTRLSFDQDFDCSSNYLDQKQKKAKDEGKKKHLLIRCILHHCSFTALSTFAFLLKDP